MRRLSFILIFLAAIGGLIAQTNFYHPGVENYHCVVCGKGPLRETIYPYKWGVVCGDCEKLPTRCSICGLPVKDGDGHVTTGDGRLICRFDKTNCILTVEQAQELFEQVRNEIVDIYGLQFELKNPDVTVKLFDVDYWSEHGGREGLHAFGFANSRPQGNGKFIHEVVMLSGEPRDIMAGVAAHEYTHLWINENRGHEINGDTIEAICELTAYKLQQRRNRPDMQEKILENTYTRGEIKTLVAVEKRMSTDYVLRWVKNGDTASMDDDAPRVAAVETPAFSYAPPVLPQGLKFNGVMSIGAEKQAVINDTAFSAGERKTIKLRDKSVSVRCDKINKNSVVIFLNDSAVPVTLKKGENKLLP
ncbi:MAG TPA: hypothetical protein VFV23_05370 [Verrucomicrobiae bacterium]|nr:hypothetical protein [Verrucomicrobiae bacterium]